MYSSHSHRDVPMRVSSNIISAERRISPSWSLEELKSKLEHVTGIPPSAQKLTLKVASQPSIIMQAPNEGEARLSSWNLAAQSEIQVEDTRPISQRVSDLNDVSSVQKYTMSEEDYSALNSSVMAWKKANKLGRFNPENAVKESERVQKMWEDASSKNILVGKRCQLGEESTRRGTVQFIGEVPEIPGSEGPWVGISLDEPVGKNNGSIGGKIYFECKENRGIFVRPERILIGDFGHLIDEDAHELEEM